MSKESIKCAYEVCISEANNHANFTLRLSGGYIPDLRTYHYNFCSRHLAETQAQYSDVKVFEIGQCDDEDCVAGKLPRLSDIQK